MCTHSTETQPSALELPVVFHTKQLRLEMAAQWLPDKLGMSIHLRHSGDPATGEGESRNHAKPPSVYDTVQIRQTVRLLHTPGTT